MTAAKFTLEILAAPEEVKFATSFMSVFRETFCFPVIPKRVSSPTHFSLCGQWYCPGTPHASQRGAWAHPDSPTEEGKWRFRQLRWGWAWCPSFSVAGLHIKRWKPRGFDDTVPTGYLGHSSWWGIRLSPFLQAKESPARLSVSMVIWPSFCSDPASLKICPSFAKEEPEPKQSGDVRIWRAVVRHVNDLSGSKLPLWYRNCCTKLKVWILCKLFILFGGFVILCIFSH